MKTATELLAEMLALHADPQKGAAELYLWLHHRKGDVKAAVERGDAEDTDRMDWLDKPWVKVEVFPKFEWMSDKTESHPNYYGKKSSLSLRAAIDRARGEGE